MKKVSLFHQVKQILIYSNVEFADLNFSISPSLSLSTNTFKLYLNKYILFMSIHERWRIVAWHAIYMATGILVIVITTPA
jgi:hypothetical protein